MAEIKQTSKFGRYAGTQKKSPNKSTARVSSSRPIPTIPCFPSDLKLSTARIKVKNELYTMSDTGVDLYLPSTLSDSSAATFEMSNMVQPAPGGLENSQRLLEQQVHMQRMKMQDLFDSNKGTETAYTRHLKNYEDWWDLDQKQRSEAASGAWTYVPAHPITSTKVAIFLEYETSRPKHRKNGVDEMPGTRLGPEHVKQCISALERYRFLHQRDEEYASCPESHKRLRDSADISFYERVAEATEPQRQAESQELKAQGVTADTFNREQLVKGSIWYLHPDRGRSDAQVHTNIRDRAMLLLTTSMALRGDVLRAIQWSNLRFDDVRLIEIDLDFTAPALVIFSNQGKTNVTGRIDEHAAFRHRIPELCCIGALALYLYSHFHIRNEKPPSFLRSLDHPKAVGSNGYFDWYDYILFPGNKSPYDKMTFENHYKRLNNMKKANNIQIRKATHSGRPYAAQEGMNHLSTSEGMKGLGLWNATNGSFRECYNRSLPSDAMLAAGAFNGRKQESYFIPRDSLEPPDDLALSIFPWVESEKAALDDRYRRQGKPAQDQALSNFLSLLQFLRRVLLQDAAVLSTKYPGLPVFDSHPFNTDSFRQFALSSSAAIEKAEEDERLKFERLPENIAASMRGALQTATIQQEQRHAHLQAKIESFGAHFDRMNVVLEASITHTVKNPKKRKALHDTLDKVSSHRPSPPPPTPSMRNTTASPSFQPVSTHEVQQSSVDSTITVPVPLSTAIPAPTPKESEFVVSGNGNIYSNLTFPCSSSSSEPELRAQQMKALSDLESKFSEERLKYHTFEWRNGEWLPDFDSYWKPTHGHLTREHIWDEYHTGMDGKLSICELTSHWKSRWKRDVGKIKVESARRSKIISLVQALKDRCGWTTDEVFQFLNKKYPIPSDVDYLRTTRAFTDYLQKNNGSAKEAISQAADLYTVRTV